MLPDIDFNLLPVPVIITNIFAVRAHGEQAFQRLNIIKRPLQPLGGFLKSGKISDDYPQRNNQCDAHKNTGGNDVFQPLCEVLFRMIHINHSKCEILKPELPRCRQY
jgi:hypothetical protein